MGDREREEEVEDEGSSLVFKTQTYADLRQLAKKNLERAERVLAESGYQLLKNKKLDTEGADQTPPEAAHGSKESDGAGE